MLEFTKDIYSVGCLNPNMRIFDIVMKTEYGTSYNSYIVKGKDKIVLIDGCHERFYDQWIANIKEITPINKIDYLIINHCEPDHTGALRKLCKEFPNIQIYTTPSGNIFLKEITNLSLNIHVVKNNEVLTLGDKTLQFLFAPLLHWPDSMFTYIKESKTVFTCDFLGSHYCEPNMVDKLITYPNEYLSSLKLYYEVIFSPFKKYVNNGLNILSKLDLDYVCTSHGPILTKDGFYKNAFDKYTEWSKEEKNDKKIIPIFYVSSYGYTKMIANAIYDGIKSLNHNDLIPTLYDINEHDIGELAAIMNNSYAFAIGSPTLNKNIVPPVFNLLSSLDTINVINKNVLVFGSYGWSGEGQEILKSLCKSLKLNVFNKDIHIRFAPNDEQIKDAKQIAIEFINSFYK